jgi:hypothetical protein
VNLQARDQDHRQAQGSLLSRTFPRPRLPGARSLLHARGYVNDNHREFRGTDAIRRFIEKEIVGDNVTMDVREVVEHYGDTIVRAAYEGDFDKTNLPDEVILSNYFSVRDNKIVSLVTIFNQLAEL